MYLIIPVFSASRRLCGEIFCHIRANTPIGAFGRPNTRSRSLLVRSKPSQKPLSITELRRPIAGVSQQLPADHIDLRQRRSPMSGHLGCREGRRAGRLSRSIELADDPVQHRRDALIVELGLRYSRHANQILTSAGYAQERCHLITKRRHRAGRTAAVGTMTALAVEHVVAVRIGTRCGRQDGCHREEMQNASYEMQRKLQWRNFKCETATAAPWSFVF